MTESRKSQVALFVLAVARGATIKAAAREAGVDESTGHRWIRKPEIKARVGAVRDQLWGEAAGALAAASTEAVAALRKLLTAKSPRIRLGAARAILESGPRLREIVDHEARLAALESLQSKGTNQ